MNSKDALKAINKKIERYNKAMKGDCDAIVECSFDMGICSKEQYDDYYKIKEQCGD